MHRLVVVFTLVDSLWFCSGIVRDVVLVQVNFKKKAQRRDDYGFHCYSELFHFVYCLLSKTRAVSSLPSIHQWDAYMSVEPVKKMATIPHGLFLVNRPFGEELLQAKMSGVREFRQDCRKFLDQLVEKIHKTVYCSSPISQERCAFCPELLFEGDDVIVFDLFAKLVAGLARCGLLTGECSVRPGVLTSCLRGVQSFVSCAGYDQSTFFTETTMDSVRRSLDAAGTFMSNASFNPWGGICVGDKSALFLSLNSAYSSYLQERVKSADSHYKTADVTNRQVFVATPVAEDTNSRASSVEKSVCAASSSRAKDDGGALEQSMFGGNASGSQRGGSLSRRGGRGQSQKVVSKSHKRSTKSTK